LIHRQGQRLHHQMIAVAIDDQAGNSVRLRPDQTAQRGIERQGVAIGHRLLDTTCKELQIEVLSAAREPAGDDLRQRIVDRGAERAIAKIL
jgi:hypothetical protein